MLHQFITFIEMATFNIELSGAPIRGGKGHSLRLRITENKQHARITLVYAVAPEQFNPKAKNGSFVRSNHNNHVKINTYLNDKLQEARDVYAEMDKKGEFISARNIKEKLVGRSVASFTRILSEHIASLLELNQIGSYKKYKSTQTIIKEYDKRENIMFQEIDTRYLRDLEKYLLNTGRKQSTIRGYFVKIRALFNLAIQEGIISSGENPFQSFKIKSGITNKDRLDIDEIQRIVELKLENNSLVNHVRNLFLFSFYTGGMRISDSLFLKWENISSERVTYIMHKTGKRHSLKLVPKSLDLLRSYDGENRRGEYIFPIINTRYNLDNQHIRHNQLSSKTALVNKYLKLIANKAEISKRITSHTARHSFADLARSKVNDLYSVSKILGHSSLTFTENYLASFDEKDADEALDKVFNS